MASLRRLNGQGLLVRSAERLDCQPRVGFRVPGPRRWWVPSRVSVEEEHTVPGQSFLGLIRRIRSGDDEASAELVEQYGEQIRRVVRVRLSGSKLRRVMDSQDICQSVLANFFARATAGEFELETPNQLLGLLATMARNKLTNKADYFQAVRRDLRRTTAGEAALENVAHQGATPSVAVAQAELVQVFRSLLTDEERRLLDYRAEGRSWGEIGAQCDDSPERLRKQLSRAIERIKSKLHCHVDGDD